MLNGLYSSATALNLNLHNQDVIAHNLAHVNVPGFKRSQQTVQTFADFDALQDAAQPAANGQGSPGGTGPNISKNINGLHLADFVTDFSQGRLEETGDRLHVAINGDGFFVVQGQTGPLYTRSGNFKLNQDSQLSLVSGQIVEGDGGPITVDNADSVIIGSDGSISVNGVNAGQLRLVQFADRGKLIPAGTTTFTAPPGLDPQPLAEDSGTILQPGFLESSNTQAVNELIRMIAGMRHFEAAQKTLTTISESIGKHTSLQTA